MADSTRFIDAAGIRRDHPILPERHAVDGRMLDALGPIVDLGSADSVERQGWRNLLAVHGYAAVLRAAACCYQHGPAPARVRNDQAQVVLDGRWEATDQARAVGRRIRRQRRQAHQD